jgi:hypothetical protein
MTPRKSALVLASFAALALGGGCGEPKAEAPYKAEVYREKLDPAKATDPNEAARRQQQMEVMEKYGKQSEQSYGGGASKR